MSDEDYEGGYSDGLGDAETTVLRLQEVTPETELLIRKAFADLRGDPFCAACKGTGERELTQRDLLLAMMELAGARTHVHLGCYECGGLGRIDKYRAKPKNAPRPSHWSDCARHNEPAYPNGPCNCGGNAPTA